MYEKLAKLFESFSLSVKSLMQMAYLPMNIQTNISWGVLVCMALVFVLTSGYNDKKKMNSGQLITLMAAYMIMLLILIAYYADPQKVIETINERNYSPPEVLVFIAVSVAFLLATAWLGSSGRKDAGGLMFVILLVPLLLLILSNGKILHDGPGIAKGFIPKFTNPFKPQSDETEKISLCTEWVRPAKLEKIITSHSTVEQSAVFAYQDIDGTIRLCAFVKSVLTQECTQVYLEDMASFVKKEFRKKKIEAYKFPAWIECVGDIPRTVGGIRRDMVPSDISVADAEAIIRKHPAVADIGLAFHQDDTKIIRSYALVVLKKGNKASEKMKKIIRRFAYKNFPEKGVGPYLVPSRIEFVKEIPRTQKVVKRKELKILIIEKMQEENF